MSQYIDKKTVANSYRPKAGTMSPGLQRARAPFAFRNALTGLILGGFGVGVYAYSISAVKQDVFDDVDEEAKAIASKGTGTTSGVGVSSEGQNKITDIPPEVVKREQAESPTAIHLQKKSFVVGAPPVDNIGKMWQKS